MTTNIIPEPIITILGPTATGKTKVAVRTAVEYDAEIISADSRQIFRRMDIGTGKDLSDYQYDNVKIPYHLIDIENPGTEYNVFKFQQSAFDAVSDIRSRGKRVILCGGSGMYIEALLKGYRLFEVPENQQLRQSFEYKTDEELIAMLASYKNLHNDTDTCERGRLIRALEIEHYYASHPEINSRVQPMQSVIFGLRGDRDLIREKITRRLHSRLQEGMVDEVKNLIDEGVNVNQLLRYGLEYKFVTKYILGELSYNEMFECLNVAIHQFSKRQMTWFRRMERQGFFINWIDISLTDDKKNEIICEILNKNGIHKIH